MNLNGALNGGLSQQAGIHVFCGFEVVMKRHGDDIISDVIIKGISLQTTWCCEHTLLWALGDSPYFNGNK